MAGISISIWLGTVHRYKQHAPDRVWHATGFFRIQARKSTLQHGLGTACRGFTQFSPRKMNPVTVDFSLAIPQWISPEWSINGMLNLAIPLILVSL